MFLLLHIYHVIHHIVCDKVETYSAYDLPSNSQIDSQYLREYLTFIHVSTSIYNVITSLF